MSNIKDIIVHKKTKASLKRAKVLEKKVMTRRIAQALANMAYNEWNDLIAKAKGKGRE